MASIFTVLCFLLAMQIPSFRTARVGDEEEDLADSDEGSDAGSNATDVTLSPPCGQGMPKCMGYDIGCYEIFEDWGDADFRDRSSIESDFPCPNTCLCTKKQANDKPCTSASSCASGCCVGGACKPRCGHKSSECMVTTLSRPSDKAYWMAMKAFMKSRDALEPPKGCNGARQPEEFADEKRQFQRDSAIRNAPTRKLAGPTDASGNKINPFALDAGLRMTNGAGNGFTSGERNM